MQQDDQYSKIHFSAKIARLGLVAYIVLILLIAAVYL